MGWPNGGGVLWFMAYTGMCCSTGHAFLPTWLYLQATDEVKWALCILECFLYVNIISFLSCILSGTGYLYFQCLSGTGSQVHIFSLEHVQGLSDSSTPLVKFLGILPLWGRKVNIHFGLTMGAWRVDGQGFCRAKLSIIVGFTFVLVTETLW